MQNQNTDAAQGRRMTRREYESRRITRTHNEWLAKRGLPVGNRFNRWEKVKSNENQYPKNYTSINQD